MKKYKWFRLRGNFYAYNFPEPMTLTKGRQWIRKWLEVDRLPYGTEIW